LNFLAAAAKPANTADGARLAKVLPGFTIESPFGDNGKLTIRADDHTLVNYAIGWGTTIPTEPYVPNITPANWNQIYSLEAEWKKKNNYA
jgi:branched-chain amino acid transport system substrate-binding protein